MSRPRLSSVLVFAALVVMALPPASSSAWAPADSAAIHPGVQVFTAGAQCTSNFVFEEGSSVYLGQAAHCSGTGGQTETDGCTSGSLPLGTPVEVKGASKPGTLVYNSWLTMQAKGETDPDTCAYNDLALIRIDPADVGSVNPSVPGFGGPTGVGTVGGSASTVYSYGNSELRGGVTKLSPKQGSSSRTKAAAGATSSPPSPRASRATRAAASSTAPARRSASSAPCSSRRWPAPTASATSARSSPTCAPTAASARCSWCTAPSRSSRAWWKRSSAPSR